MKITQNVDIYDRKSLAKVRIHLEKERALSRQKTEHLYKVFFEKWDFERVSISVLKGITAKWIGESITTAISSFTKVKMQHKKGSSWFSLALNMIQELVPLLFPQKTAFHENDEQEAAAEAV
jgi:hypothetical protein